MKKVRLISALTACAFLMGGCSMIESLLGPDDRGREEDDEDEDEDEDEEETEETTEPAALVAPDEHGRDNTPETDQTDSPEPSETTVIEVDEDYGPAYIETINDYIDSSQVDPENLRYDLIYIDEDNIPELIIDYPGFFLEGYTYSDGTVHHIMDYWPYGAMGNAGYSYLPHQNVITNSNNDLAGALIWQSVWEIDDNFQIVSKLDDELNIRYFESEPDEFYPEDFNNIEYTDSPYYYYGTTPITQSEYLSYIPEGDYDWIGGVFDYDTIIEALETGVMPDRPSVYYLMVENCTWDEAQQKAEDLGGELACIDTQEELETISSLVLESEYTNIIFYVGAIRNNAGNMVWLDGNTIGDFVWFSGEPSTTGATEDGRTVDENYGAVLYRSDEQSLRLMDVPNDMLDAAPSYNNIIGYIIEYVQ